MEEVGQITGPSRLESREKEILIRKAYEALPPGGAFVVIEALIDDARRENAFGVLMSLNMLIEFGAREFPSHYLRVVSPYEELKSAVNGSWRHFESEGQGFNSPRSAAVRCTWPTPLVRWDVEAALSDRTGSLSGLTHSGSGRHFLVLVDYPLVVEGDQQARDSAALSTLGTGREGAEPAPLAQFSRPVAHLVTDAGGANFTSPGGEG